MPHARMPPVRQWPALVPAPDSITWQRAGDGRLLMAAGYALLLQVSHPTVGAGVSEHSSFRSDPWGRLLRTLDYTYTMVYGGPQAAGEMGRRIRAMHTRIRGQRPDGLPYHALEPAPYAWVHATLAEAIVAAHERFGCALSAAERERYWREWRALGRLLGLASVGMLGPGLRARFGLSWSAASELQLRALGTALRAATPLMPAWLANTGPGYLRRRGPALAA